jgi:putative Mg2+ transporter-C (MgtC) family protein
VWADGGQGVDDVFREEFSGMLDAADACRLGLRLLVALLMGAVLGYQREKFGKAAGLRTHMLVSLAAALFTAVPMLARMDSAAVSRVVQGLAAGIGFIGGGAILKLTDERKIRGLTTAASLWLASAVGVAAGMGRHGAAVLGTVAGFLILSLLGRLEREVEGPEQGAQPQRPPVGGQNPR